MNRRPELTGAFKSYSSLGRGRNTGFHSGNIKKNFKNADRIIVIEDGCVAQDGSRNEVFPKLMLGVEACEFYGRSVNFEHGA